MARSSGFTAVMALAMSACFVAAQTQDKANNVGTAAATSQSKQYTIPAAGCVTFGYNLTRTPGFNYTAYLGLAKLPDGCETSKIQILKQYTHGACPETRANNYGDASLKITNTCTDFITTADKSTCVNTFAKAPTEAYASSGIGAGQLVDTGNVCWDAPEEFYFVKNECTASITATIKLTVDTYSGACDDAADTDDGGDDAGGTGSTDASSGGGGGLSSGAKAGIAIGVIAAVALVAVLSWFFCCQLRKQ